MKSKNIPADIKSKSLKETKEEIDRILSELEKKDVNLESYIDEYKRLIQLNNHVDFLFKSKSKELTSLVKKKLK
tara:strand:+ start:1391 stop:1612 length:222 start_codon:yes stop_codon:yes gene_type:complete